MKKLSDIAKEVQALITVHGDLECLSDDCRPIISIDVEISEGQYPADWGMPAGFKFVRISEDR